MLPEMEGQSMKWNDNGCNRTR